MSNLGKRGVGRAVWNRFAFALAVLDVGGRLGLDGFRLGDVKALVG